MEILGIGLPELVFIFVIALLVLGPRDMQKSARTVGIWLNKFIKSNLYQALRNSSTEIRNMSTNLMRDANLELKKTDEQIRREMQMDPRASKFMVQTGGDRPVKSKDAPVIKEKKNGAKNKKVTLRPKKTVKASKKTESEPNSNA